MIVAMTWSMLFLPLLWVWILPTMFLLLWYFKVFMGFLYRDKLSMSRMTFDHLSKHKGSNGRLSTFDIKHWLASIDGLWWWCAYCCLSKHVSSNGKLLALNMKHWLTSIVDYWWWCCMLLLSMGYNKVKYEFADCNIGNYIVLELKVWYVSSMGCRKIITWFWRRPKTARCGWRWL